MNRANYDCTHNFPLILIQNCNHVRFVSYVLTFSSIENNEINNRLKYLCGGGGVNDIEARTIDKGIPLKGRKA